MNAVHDKDSGHWIDGSVVDDADERIEVVYPATPNRCVPAPGWAAGIR